MEEGEEVMNPYTAMSKLIKEDAFPFILGLMITLMILLSCCAYVHAEPVYLKASWYSVESLKKEGTYAYSHGRMANGKSFTDSGFTCACNLYPLNSRLLVRNLENGKTVEVQVTDHISKRFATKRIDLSKGAFSKIADCKQGIVAVKVEKLK